MKTLTVTGSSAALAALRKAARMSALGGEESVTFSKDRTPALLRELEETARDLRDWDGSTDVIEITERNIAAAIAKARGQ